MNSTDKENIFKTAREEERQTSGEMKDREDAAGRRLLGSRWYEELRTQAGVPSVVQGESKAKELDFNLIVLGIQGRL